MYLRAHPKRKSLISGVTAADKHSLKSRSLGLFYFFMRSKQPKKLHIRVQWKDHDTEIMCGGVYKIWFGDKFYIGRTRYLWKRIRSHERDLNNRKKGRWWTITGPQDFYQFVIAHLKKNPQIQVAYMEVLERCDTDEALVAAEQKYFDMHEWDTNCLNLGLVATPYKPTEPKQPKPQKEKKVKTVKVKIKKDKKPLKKKGKPVKPVKIPPHVTNAKLWLLQRTMDKLEKEYSKPK